MEKTYKYIGRGFSVLLFFLLVHAFFTDGKPSRPAHSIAGNEGIELQKAIGAEYAQPSFAKKIVDLPSSCKFGYKEKPGGLQQNRLQIQRIVSAQKTRSFIPPATHAGFYLHFLSPDGEEPPFLA